jgi:hypothetical protein
LQKGRREVQPSYRVAFDLADQPFRLNPPSVVVPLILTVVGALLVFMPARMQRLLPNWPMGVSRKGFSWFYFLGSGFSLMIFAYSWINSSLTLRSVEKNGAAQVVEGCMETFHPMPVTGHDTERLTIKGQAFEYSDYIITPAFSRTESHGGPVHADSRLKIFHVGGDIVRLEVADHACPPAEDKPNR